MHIGFLTPEYVRPETPDGGLANYLRKVSFSLAGKGHDVSILVLSNKNSSWYDESVKICEVKKPMYFSKANFFPYLSPLAQIISSKHLAKIVWKIHRDTPFDIIQAPSYKALGYGLLHNNKIPVVCRASSYTPMKRTAYGRRRSFRDYLSDWLEIRQILDADGSFAPSYFVAKIIERVEGRKLEVIRTPVEAIDDVKVDTSYYQEYLAGRQYLFFFGTLSRIKGADLLAEVLPYILKKNNELYFVLIGRDDGLPNGKRVFDAIYDHCQNYKDRLHYHPPLRKSQLYPIISNALGVIMPSRFDNYPNACLEAQSMGVPVVGTYESSLDEMIVDGETGFLAENDNVSSLREAIERLLDQTLEQRKEMRKQILRYVDTVSSEDRISQLESFYKKSIDNYYSRH